MVKLQNRKFALIAVLVMLTSSNITINYAYSEEFVTKETSGSGHLVKTVVAEMVQDGKFIVKVLQVSSQVSSLEIDQLLSNEGSIVGWALIKGESAKSGIVLYNGKTIQDEIKRWQNDQWGSTHQNVQELRSSEGKNQKILEYKVVFEIDEDPQPFSYIATESSEFEGLDIFDEKQNKLENSPKNQIDSMPIMA